MTFHTTSEDDTTMAASKRALSKTKFGLTAAVAALSCAILPAAHAEMSEIHVSRQYGISYLPLMIMEDRKLIEKHAKATGIDVTVDWSKFASGAVMNDALLSGNLQFASGGVGPFTTLWAKTRGNLDVKAVSAINSMPLFLVTNNPKVKTLKDFTDNDKIALPAVKVSIQAVTLQMAAEKAFGAGQQSKLDHLTVSMSHPDAETALLSGTEITAHLGSPPFQYQELAHKGMHKVFSSYDVLGGPATFNVVWTTSKFHDENPKVYAAFVAALDEATTMINHDKRAAAQTYLRVSKDKDSLDNILKMLNDPAIKYTTTPNNVMKYVDFMYKIGSIKAKPDSWKEMFFPNAHNLPGS
ncbi:MAG: ABC transporter substrate-binding protein [Pseudomonadota bacterium]|nr:ABC transporter substrate-binding protein [Pseudomonadota bacterium]